jgi:PepSY-associated TM region
LGAYAEYYLTDDFYVDNGNLLNVPGSRIVNLNLHYDTDIQNSFIQKIGAYFEVRNVFNATNLASANNITNTISSVTTLPFLLNLAVTGGLYLFIPEIDHLLYRSLKDVPARAAAPLPASVLVQKTAAGHARRGFAPDPARRAGQIRRNAIPEQRGRKPHSLCRSL